MAVNPMQDISPFYSCPEHGDGWCRPSCVKAEGGNSLG